MQQQQQEALPVRKANSPAISATTKLDNSSPGKENKRPDEKSAHQKGTSQSFLVRRRSGENCGSVLGERQNGFPGNVRESSLAILRGCLGRNKESQRCRPDVSKFAPKRRSDPELREDDVFQGNNPNAVQGPDGHEIFLDRLNGASNKITAAVSPATNASGEDKVEKDGCRVQLTQFAYEFASAFATTEAAPTSEPMGICEASDKKRTVLAVENLGGSKKQRLDDDFEEDIIPSTPFLMLPDFTGDVVGSSGHEADCIIQERTVELQKSSGEYSINSGVSSPPDGLAAGQIAEREHPFIEKLDGPVNTMYGAEYLEREKTQGGATASGLAKTSLPYSNLAGGTSKGSVSGCTAASGDLQSVSRERGASLSPGFKSPEGRRVLGAGPRTPKSGSKSQGTGDEGGLCCTPYSGRSKKLEKQSSSNVKAGSWQYYSMLSPGDAFWDEAIEAADGLLVSELDEPPPNKISPGKNGSSGASSDRSVDVVGRRLDNQVEGVRGIEGRVKDAGGDPGFCLLETDIKEVLKSEGRIGTDDRNNVGRVSEVDISPLPVRHIMFTCQNSPPDKSIDVLKMIQCSPDALLPKLPNLKYVVASHQAGTEVDDEDISIVDKACWEMEVAKRSKNGVIVNSAPCVVLNTRPTLIKPVLSAPGPMVEPSSDAMSHANTELSRGGPSERLGSSGSTFVAVAGKRGKEDASIATSSPKHSNLELSQWLPPEICAMYAKKGLTKLYPWQVECLQLGGVLEGRSLVYCASTSAGKSLVAEVLMLRRILSTGKKALLVLPYVTLCTEKAEHLDALLEPLGRRVRGFYGSQGGGSLPTDTSVAVCTIEKANSLINKLLEEGRLMELAIIVIDELHMVGDRDRGYLLELLLTKLRYAAGGGHTTPDSSSEESMSLSRSWKTDLQIVGMSATMPNVSDVATWLQAALYQTEYRPVPLEEFMKVGQTIFNKKMEVVRTIRDGADLGGKDPDHVAELCQEVVTEGHSVLLFCSSRKGCETTARHIAKFLPPFSPLERKNATGPKDGNAAVDELRRSPAGLDCGLADTLPAGVAYHHAGLTVEERNVIEACFKSGVVRVLVATSTLAAGVNLPARRVIFRQPKIGRDFIDATRYRQMAGRAGRAGIDSKGESILICKPEEAKRMEEMMSQDCKALQSCLADDKNGMTRALLEVVAGGVVRSAADVQRYVRCTLLNATQPFEEVVKAAQDSLRWLCHQHLLGWDASSQLYITTTLGRAAFASSLSPEESLVVFEDLAKAREGLVLASDLHLLYEVTPTYVDLEPDWVFFYHRFMELSPIDQAVGNKVGVCEQFLLRLAHGAPVLRQRSNGRSRGGKSVKDKITTPVQKRWTSPNGAQLAVDQKLRVCKRFYVALMLSNLVQEVSLMEVCESFKVPRGTVQGLQDSAGRFASMIAAFCERLGWSDMESLVSKFQKRVSFGVKSEIVDLTEIPFVKAARARALYKAGFRSIQAVAEATPAELVDALYGSTSWPGQGDRSNGGQQWVQVGIARKIKHAARRIALDRAEEARAAAFSAYQALGVHIPAGLASPLLVTASAHEEEAQRVPADDTSPQSMEDLGIINGVDASSGALDCILETQLV